VLGVNPAAHDLVTSPDIYGESEVLIRRPVTGASVTDSWTFGEEWGFNGTR